MNIDYYTQRDNTIEPSNTCFPTAYAMAVNYIYGLCGVKPPQKELDEFIIKWMYEKNDWLKKQINYSGEIKARSLWDCYKHVKKELFNILPFQQTFCKMTGIEIRETILESELPVVVGTYLTHGGHIVLATDVFDGGLICHDPWGDAKTKYSEKNGKDIQYKFGENGFPKADEKVHCIWFKL